MHLNLCRDCTQRLFVTIFDNSHKKSQNPIFSSWTCDVKNRSRILSSRCTENFTKGYRKLAGQACTAYEAGLVSSKRKKKLTEYCFKNKNNKNHENALLALCFHLNLNIYNKLNPFWQSTQRFFLSIYFPINLTLKITAVTMSVFKFIAVYRHYSKILAYPIWLHSWFRGFWLAFIDH